MASLPPIRIKASNQLEFDGAESEGYVYGTFSKYVQNEWKEFYVFAWLGQQISYQESSNDDLNASYKMFSDCTIRVALTAEKLDAEEFLVEDSSINLIIYW
jgi:hypothetical protein